MTSPELFPQQEPQPGQDSLAANRAFNVAYAVLVKFEAPASDSRFLVNLTDKPTKTAELFLAV